MTAFGPWISAQFAGSCDMCGEWMHVGARIRSDGEGGWLCEECGTEPYVQEEAPSPALYTAERFDGSYLTPGVNLFRNGSVLNRLSEREARKLADELLKAAGPPDASEDLGVLVAEILAVFDPSKGDGYRARVGYVQITNWRKRAGIEEGL